MFGSSLKDKFIIIAYLSGSEKNKKKKSKKNKNKKAIASQKYFKKGKQMWLFILFNYDKAKVLRIYIDSL